MSFISYTVSGIIAPLNNTMLPSGAMLGLDGGNYFGGGSLANKAYSVTWTANDCECTSIYSNPIADVTLTINNQTYDFGSGWYGIFYLHGQQQTDFLDGGSFIYTNSSFNGEFEIINNANFSTQISSGMFMLGGVPGPIIGAGLPGLVMVLVLLLFFHRRSFLKLESNK